ncbi:unnamed protein product [Vitrella brassicaformis CCMP3155]|uniref:RING-type domain-containing protein n=1 Tax=Vitrella brassicaformis (strain CCMP3155) TaxID=1169540 RepID=A0A0G4GHE4_VITBC|nr:unnamed protein product [Vitrella brassicaformis CCMP3155]|eukprot:CEM28907.1 unnamed protein product [Vitrella brassicaformis CCMP3155]
MAAARVGGDEQHLSCEICTNAYSSTGRRTPQVLRCGHSYCADCIGDLRRHAANNVITCANRCGVATPADQEVQKCYQLTKAVEAKEQQERQQLGLLHKCATAAHSLSPPEVAVVVLMCGLSHAMDTLPNMRSRLHGYLRSSIEGSMVSRLHEMCIAKWINAGSKSLRLIYQSSRDGPSYGDLLRCVGDTKGLVFVIHKPPYTFGAFISAGLQLPDDPTDENIYGCDGWEFSLAGHFSTPKITTMEGSRTMFVAGREGTGNGAKLEIVGFGVWLGLGCEGGAADDMRSCHHFILSDYLPEGYVGVRDEHGLAVFGGSQFFMADEVEVLTVV